MRSPIALIAIGIVLMGAGTASADPISVGQIIKLQLPSVPRFEDGGPFVVDLAGTANDFLTFCLEYNEHFAPGEDLRVGSITNEAKAGGVSGSTGTGDPISATTAYLYANFRNGTTGYTNGALVQQAIWFLEGEISSVGVAAQLMIALANVSVLGKEAYYLSQVQVLNLYRGGPNFTTRAQDMLTYTPVPEATSALLFGLGALGAMAARRRRQLR
jgi:PEP-CTERM motif